MAHGVTDYGLNWVSVADKFHTDYDIIMYDARGHGGTKADKTIMAIK